jgi:hypothetical protein
MKGTGESAPPRPSDTRAVPPEGRTAEETSAPLSRPLVWPPPEAELDEWEIITLRGSDEPEPHPAPSPPSFEIVRPDLDDIPLHASSESGSTSDQAPPADLFLGSVSASFSRLPLPRDPSPAPPPAPRVLLPPAGPRALPQPLPRPAPPAPSVSGTARVPDDRAAARRQRGPTGWLAAAGLLVLALTGYGLAMLTPGPRPRSPLATLVVDSTPPGARVLLDGAYHGQTPMRLALPPGRRKLAVEMSGVRRDATLDLTDGADVVRHFDFGPPPPPVVPAAATGSLEVRTQPPGARVVVDGEQRGVTPLVITDLPAGVHDVQLASPSGTATRRATVDAGRTSVLSLTFEAPATTQPGWLRIRADLPLQIVSGGRALRATPGDRITLTPGRHDLELINEEFEVRLQRSIVVSPARETILDIDRPQGRVSMNAVPWAEVWAGSERLGETPLGNVSLPVGRIDLIFRHPQLGELRRTVMVRALTPARVAVSFEQ